MQFQPTSETQGESQVLERSESGILERNARAKARLDEAIQKGTEAMIELKARHERLKDAEDELERRPLPDGIRADKEFELFCR